MMLAALLADAVGAAEPSTVSFRQETGKLHISIGKQTVATYIYEDAAIRRPYFRHLKTLSGLQVTRNHPPVKNQDLDDHPTMHPGLWLAFGDLNGADFWRNKGLVKHLRFLEPPKSGVGQGSFQVENQYEAAGKTICTETSRISISVQNEGYLIDWVSTFQSDGGTLIFGDQEEMGLGVRVATSLAVVKGGTITNSEHRKNGSEVWGKQADWCEYSGKLNDQRVGIVVMPHPKNFRRSWFHARDYGLLVANPFGQNAFTKAEKSRIAVKSSENFELKFGVLVYEGDFAKPQKAYQEYVAESVPPQPFPASCGCPGGVNLEGKPQL